MLAEIGTPICVDCGNEGVENEAIPVDDPIPVIVTLTDGKQSIKKIICRPADMSFAVFQAKVFQAWQEWKKGGPRGDIPDFETWLDLSCNIHCMFAEAMTV
jgi:hypothetical protein